MNSNLARALMTKGIIRQGTVIHAYHNVRGLSCECDARVMVSFIINRARLFNGTHVVFDAIDPEQVMHAIQSEQVIMVDGMVIDRIAVSHNLSMEGIERVRKTRRGRRKTSP